MPGRLKRVYDFRELHFITCSCYRRRQLLRTKQACDLFLRIFEQVRRKHKFEVVGYVVMPALSYFDRGARKGKSVDCPSECQADRC